MKVPLVPNGDPQSAIFQLARGPLRNRNGSANNDKAGFSREGVIAAIAAGARELAVFASASETFAMKNTNCTIAESIERFVPVLALAKANDLPVRGYVSCAVDCPYEGAITPAAVARVAEQLARIGCNEIAVADTIGRARPDRVDDMLRSSAVSEFSIVHAAVLPAAPMLPVPQAISLPVASRGICLCVAMIMALIFPLSTAPPTSPKC